MKLWVSKIYWWAVPVGLGVLFSILLFAYNFFPTHFLYHLQGALPVIWFFAAIAYFFSIFFIACGVVCFRLFQKEQLTPMLKFLTIGPFIFVFSIVASAAPLSLKSRPLPPNFDLIEFDRNLWAKNDYYKPDKLLARQAMTTDLINSHLNNIDCQETIALLGSPDVTPDTKLCNNGSIELLYGLGMSQYFLNFMDWDVLSISFSGDGQIDQVKVYQLD